MAFTKDDVGPRFINGRVVLLPDETRAAIADEWNANAASASADRERQELEQKRQAAFRAMSDRALAAALEDPAAPQAVKDYAALLQAKR